jgi:hypothetical protein
MDMTLPHIKDKNLRNEQHVEFRVLFLWKVSICVSVPKKTFWTLGLICQKRLQSAVTTQILFSAWQLGMSTNSGIKFRWVSLYFSTGDLAQPQNEIGRKST